MKAALIFLVAGGFGYSAYWAVGQTADREAPAHPARNAYVAPTRTVDLNVLVLDREKHPEPNLDGARFQVLEDGVSRTIESVTGADGPVSLCLLVDESGSTKAMSRPIVDAEVALVQGLPAGSEVMVVHFADRAYLDIPFTPVASVDQVKLRQMSSRGGTALSDAVVAADVYVMAGAHQKRRALVIISDGGDNASTLNMEQAIVRISRLGAPLIYALGPQDANESPANREHSERNLKMLTRAGGGVALIAYNAKDMARMTDEISAMIASQVVISFASAEAASAGQWHKLEVRRAGDKRQEVHALAGYDVPRQGP